MKSFIIEGGARIVQTHGTGLIHGDGSAIQQTERSLNQQRIHSDRSVEQQRTTLIQERSEGKYSGISSPPKSSHKEVGLLNSARLYIFSYKNYNTEVVVPKIEVNYH